MCLVGVKSGWKERVFTLIGLGETREDGTLRREMFPLKITFWFPPDFAQKHVETKLAKTVCQNYPFMKFMLICRLDFILG